MDKVLRYFLGSSSPQGYVSRPDQLGEPGGWRCWVVQGGAAASRSAVIARARRVIEEFGCEAATPNEARELLGLR